MATNNGIKFSQPGIDVEKVADYDSYFYSGWPWLKIAKTGTLVYDTTNNGVIPNPLNYPCFALAFKPDSDLQWYGLSVSSSKLTLIGNPGDVFQYFFFTLPLNKNYDSETVKPIGTRTVSKATRGIQFNPSGIESGALRDYQLNSQFKSPLIHKVIYKAVGAIPDGDYTTVKGLEYIVDLPYQPLIFPFYSADNDTFTLLNNVAPSTPKINYDGLDRQIVRGIVINTGSVATGSGCFVILKQPDDLGAIVQVTL